MSKFGNAVLIEQFVHGKSADDTQCEDVIALSDNFAAVIDGASSKASPMRPGFSPGKLIATAISEAILNLPPHENADAAIDYISKYAKGKIGGIDLEGHEEAAATVVMASFARREIWRVGDCLVRVNGQEYPSQNTLEKHVAAVRAAYNLTLLLSGRTVDHLREDDNGRTLILPLLKNQHLLLNSTIESDFTFGAINGNPVPRRYLEIYAIPKTTCDVVLCSDGYPRALGSLRESEDYLAEILREDPLCISRFVATKGVRPGNSSYDDRAYVRFRI